MDTFCRCYLRVSTEDQAKEGYSLPAQRSRLGAFAESQGWRVAEFYVDEGFSAKDMERPALRQMLHDLRPGEVVLVYKLDRLTRNVGDLHHLLTTWETKQIGFRSVTEDFNTTTAAGRLFIRLVADLAQWERENLAERVRFVMAKRAEDGEWNGGPAPWGYEAVPTGELKKDRAKKKLVPSVYAPIVLEIYERYVDGQGMRSIVRWLNEERKIPSARGGAFTDATVSGILKNPVYCGLTAWDWGVKNGPKNPEAVVSEGKHPAIVPKELWEQAQRVRETRISMPPRHSTGDNILTGIGRCGLCGSAIKINKHKRYRNYRCGAYATKRTCMFSGVSADKVEGNFVEAVCRLGEQLTEPEIAKKLLQDSFKDETAQVQVSPEEIQKQQADAKRAIRIWDQALEEGRITFDQWEEKVRSHQRRLEELRASAERCKQMNRVDQALDELIPHMQNFRALWDEATNSERKSLAMSFFEKVYIYPDARVDVVPRLRLEEVE